MSEGQLAWLAEQLREAAAARERVLVACHLCFHPATCAPACLMWNYDQVLQVGVRCGLGCDLWAQDSVLTAPLGNRPWRDASMGFPARPPAGFSAASLSPVPPAPPPCLPPAGAAAVPRHRGGHAGGARPHGWHAHG